MAGPKEGGMKLHAVMAPFPTQGHINPFLQLARQLVRVHGFAVTFVNTTHNHERIMKSSQTGNSATTSRWDSGIKFVAVSDGYSPITGNPTADLLEFVKGVMNMGPTFEELFEQLLTETSITCLIRDVNMPCAHNAAKKHGIPVAALATMSAVATHCYYHYEKFVTQGLLPLPAPPPEDTLALETSPSFDKFKKSLRPPRNATEAAARRRPVGHALPGLAPDLTVEELPSSFLTHSLDTWFLQTLRPLQNELLSDCDCLMVNTFHELEVAAIHAMDQSPVKLSVGPLVFTSEHSSSGNGDVEPLLSCATCPLWEEDPATLLWLEAQQRASVLFVSFGSLATISVEQLKEIAHGLGASKHPFLWVIREDLVEGDEGKSDSHEFPDFLSGFKEATRDRGFITPWVSQTAVLSHASVGAFLTHCGWNSTLESIAAGVPMVVLPMFAEQRVNAFYVTQVWGNGVRLERCEGVEVVSREEVEEKVRSVLAEVGGDEIMDMVRRRARDLRRAAKKAVMPGGSSSRAMANFVNQIAGRESGGESANAQ